MSSWTPTKEKLATTVFLVTLWIIYTTTSGLATKTYKEYAFNMLAPSNYRNNTKEPTKEHLKATQAARQEITIETVQKIEIAGYINASAQLSLGLLIAYFGSCFIHRRSSSGNA
ncbi:hypothetical protein D3C78_569200 [compost metagenome]